MKEQVQKKLTNRLHIINGQIKGLEKMVAGHEYCPDIIRLSLAVQKSLQSFNQALLQTHLEDHAAKQFKQGHSKQAIKELLDLYYLDNK